MVIVNATMFFDIKNDVSLYQPGNILKNNYSK